MPSTRYSLRSNPQALAEQEPTQSFRFLSLPPELRLRIYRLLLKRAEPISLCQFPYGADSLVLETHRPTPPTTTTTSTTTPTTSTSTASTTTSTTTHLQPTTTPPSPSSPPLHSHEHDEPLSTTILAVSKLLHTEARPVLYSENTFTVHTGSAIRSLNALHQRSRSLIRHVSLSIPSHYDILDEFPDIVRLGLRYCWGLKTLVVHLPFVMPDESERSDIGAGNAGNVVGNGVGCGGRICGSGGSSSRRSSVFANAFHIIRWLPKQTVVRLEGIVPWDIADVVEGHMLENEVGESEGSGRERERVSDIHVLEPMFLN